MTTSAQQHQELADGLLQLRGGALDVAAFARLARGQTALLAALPPPFASVLQHLLDRLESAALFSEESCSFSQKELLDSLQQWLDHAQGQLARENPA
ncbi:MAG: hypothetical protein C0428_11235 [Polaromonas sp.]|nr:hypothetical protein [Polaromonas sp.]